MIGCLRLEAVSAGGGGKSLNKTNCDWRSIEEEVENAGLIWHGDWMTQGKMKYQEDENKITPFLMNRPGILNPYFFFLDPSEVFLYKA